MQEGTARARSGSTARARRGSTARARRGSTARARRGSTACPRAAARSLSLLCASKPQPHSQTGVLAGISWPRALPPTKVSMCTCARLRASMACPHKYRVHISSACPQKYPGTHIVRLHAHVCTRACVRLSACTSAHAGREQ
eukprot:4953042-Pleurochrysis_carterae.AAC.1